MDKINNICSKILIYWQKFTTKFYGLAIIAFIISLIPLSSAITKFLLIIIPAFIYTLNNKKIANFKFVLKFWGIYILLYILKLLVLTTVGLINSTYVISIIIVILLTLLKIASFVLVETIMIFAGFYITNSIATLLIKLLDKNKYTAKITNFFSLILIKCPHWTLSAIIVILISVNIFQFFTYEKGSFKTITIKDMNAIRDASVYSIDDTHAIIFNPAYYNYIVINNKTNKVENIGNIGIEKGINEYLPTVRLNEDNILMLNFADNDTLNSNGSVSHKLIYSIFNTDKMTITERKVLNLEGEHRLSLLNLAPNKILFLTISDRIYLFDNGKVKELKRLAHEITGHKLLKLDSENCLAVGIYEDMDTKERTRIVEQYDIKNEKSTILYSEKLPKGRSVEFIDAFHLSDGKIILLDRNNIDNNELTFTVIGSDYKKLSEKILDYKTDLPLSLETVTLMKNDKLLITGGYLGDYKHGYFNKKAYIYNVNSDKLTQIKNKNNTGRIYGSGYALTNSQVVLINGHNNYELNKIDIFTP